MENITSEVCRLSRCSVSDVYTKSRKLEIVRARHILISYNHLILLQKQEDSVHDFNVKHSMVCYCIRSVQNQFETNREYRELFGELLLNNKKMLTHRFNSYKKIVITEPEF